MKSWKKPTNELIDKALQSTKKGTARKYFFSRLENPLWLKPLVERGYLRYPPEVLRFDDGTIQFPYWPELQYLKNVCRDAPDEVIDLVLSLPKVNNPVVYDGILDIALQLPGEQSAKLKPKILEYTSIEHQWQTHRYADLLAHWTAENQISAALELLKILVAFAPDPQSEEKQKMRKEDPMNWRTLLHPSPQFDFWVYHETLKGIRSLAEREPYDVASILIDTTRNMIRLRTHQEDLDKEEDHSKAWCNLLNESDSESPEKILVHTLTFACEKVFKNFEKSPNAVVDLDRVLRKQQWKIFKRLRYHLYAQYPNEQTKPWIRKSILTHEDYDRSEYSYEFQQMIKQACECFGETLLTKAERIRIFDAILRGPSKENYRHWIVGWLGEEFTEDRFRERRERFHLSQLTPFTSVLFGKYETCFQESKDENSEKISDENYLSSKVKVGAVSNRSPRTPEQLANLTDEKLLDFINEWEKEDDLTEPDPFVKINIETLANTFQTVFRESIISNPVRLKFWMENREKIERPIYVRKIIYAIETYVKEKNLDQLNKWLTFSEWVLTHSDQKHGGDYRGSDESRENQDWSSARRAVCDFIGTCLEEDVDVPVTARGELATLLATLCTQFDWRLDKNKPTVLNRYDPLTEGISNTRSLALQKLIKFGFWLQRHDSESEASEVTTILEKRFTQETEYPLTLPEYAVLAVNYHRIFHLNETWAVKHKSVFFPRETLGAWLAAFGSFINYSRPFKPTFEILYDDFNFALQNLANFENHEISRKRPIDILGQHLFVYYLWDLYPLRGEESLLEQYYKQTNNNREHWANLFKDIGHRLWNSGKNLDQNMVDRIIAFFEWRLKQTKPTELRYFTFWLQAECLDPQWRLNAYSKVLDVCEVEDWGFHFKTLCDMLPNHTAKVIECFFKLTERNKKDIIYIQTEEAKTILKAGLNSDDGDVRHKAKGALDNLLKLNRFELLDLLNLDDGKA